MTYGVHNKSPKKKEAKDINVIRFMRVMNFYI